MSERIAYNQLSSEVLIQNLESAKSIIRLENLNIITDEYYSGTRSYTSPGFYVGRIFVPGSYIPGTPGYRNKSVNVSEFQVSENMTFNILEPNSKDFEVKFSLKPTELEQNWTNGLFAMALYREEDVNVTRYFNPDYEEIGEEEYFDNVDDNYDYYEEEETIRTDKFYDLSFAPLVFNTGFKIDFNIKRENVNNKQTILVCTKPVPYEFFKGTEILRALKKSILNNTVDNDLPTLKKWDMLSRNMLIPAQVRIIIQQTLKEYKSQNPHAEEVLSLKSRYSK